MTPLLWPLWWAATRSSASSTATFRPRPASAMAVPRPTSPPPTMATSEEPSSAVMKSGGRLRGQPLDPPTVLGMSLVAQTVVQPAGPSLPEFDAVGVDEVAAPVVREGNVAVREALGGRRYQLFELVAAGEGPALGRGPGSQARAPRAGVEV